MYNRWTKLNKIEENRGLARQKLAGVAASAQSGGAEIWSSGISWRRWRDEKMRLTVSISCRSKKNKKDVLKSEKDISPPNEARRILALQEDPQATAQ